MKKNIFFLFLCSRHSIIFSVSKLTEKNLIVRSLTKRRCPQPTSQARGYTHFAKITLLESHCLLWIWLSLECAEMDLLWL